MLKKLMFLTTLVLMFGLVNSALATAYTWTGAGTQYWTDVTSWTGGPPVAGDNAYIEAGVPGAIIDWTMTLGISKVAIGYNVAGDAYLTMNGGTLNVDDRVYVGGEKGNTSSNGNFVMNFGTINLTGVESSERKFYVGYKGPNDKGYFTMNSGTINDAGKFYIAADSTTQPWGQMTMNGGTVNCIDRVRVGGKSGTGYLYMNGGTINVLDGNKDFGVNDEDAGGGAGYLYMTGGNINVADRFRLNYKGKSDSVAEVYLHGGIIDAHTLSFNDQAEAGASALLDITLGTLLVSGDVVSDMMDLVAAGLITAYGGHGEVLVNYHPSWDKTIVNAIIPEPATIALLGLGGLLLRRRK